jgi:hypothetical protein
MILKLITVGLLALPLGGAFASEFVAEESRCVGSCSLSADEVALAGDSKWYCLAKDSCGKSYIPECGNTCFSHAVDDAVALCAESSEDKSTCEVVSPKNGSCSKDREALVKLAKK